MRASEKKSRGRAALCDKKYVSVKPRASNTVFIPEPTCHRKHDQRFFNSERLDRVKAAPPRRHSYRSARSNNFRHFWTSLGTSFPSRRQLRMMGSFKYSVPRRTTGHATISPVHTCIHTCARQPVIRSPCSRGHSGRTAAFSSVQSHVSASSARSLLTEPRCSTGTTQQLLHLTEPSHGIKVTSLLLTSTYKILQ